MNLNLRVFPYYISRENWQLSKLFWIGSRKFWYWFHQANVMQTFAKMPRLAINYFQLWNLTTFLSDELRWVVHLQCFSLSCSLGRLITFRFKDDFIVTDGNKVSFKIWQIYASINCPISYNENQRLINWYPQDIFGLNLEPHECRINLPFWEENILRHIRFWGTWVPQLIGL